MAPKLPPPPLDDCMNPQSESIGMDEKHQPDNCHLDVVSEPSVRVLRQFRQVFNSVRTHFKAVEKQAGVSGAQLWALSLVSARPGLGIGALAAAMDVHQTTASNLVRSLGRSGLVTTERDPSDRRAVKVTLLDAGIAVLARAPGPFTGVLPEALRRLEPARLLRLEDDLTVLIRALDADQTGAGIPLADM